MPVAPTSGITAHTYTVIKWTGETGTGLRAEVGRYVDITVQATGSGTVTVEGSNDGTNWVALKDPTGAAISLAAGSNAMAVLLEHPVLIRPVVAGGTATITAVASANR